MRWIRCFIGAVALTATTLPGAALAQAIPDLQDLVVQGEQINRGVEEAIGGRTDGRGGDGGAIDGEAGVYVLAVNEIFNVSASGGLGYTDNPTRTADPLKGSLYADASFAAGMATRLGGKVDFGLAASVGGRNYFDARQVSSRTASASMSAGLPIVGPVYLGAVAFGGYSYDTDFQNGTAFYGVSGSLSAALPLTDRIVVRPGVGTTRQWSAVSENDSTLVAASVDLLVAMTPRMSASVRAVVTRRWYDDFYEDTTFVERRDLTYDVSASLSYRLTENLGVSASAGYTNQNSTFFLSEYEARDAVVAVSLTGRF